MGNRTVFLHEKGGNTAWLACPGCSCWFPVAPRMLDPAAPACICPACHTEFKPEKHAAT